MGSSYLGLAVVLAFAINMQNRGLRSAGTGLIALCLLMIIVSILLADFDGTFAAIPATAPLIDRLTPAILNAQAALAAGAILFLLWAARVQLRRQVQTTPPLHNTPDTYGHVSRFLHWTIAVLMFCLVPIGLFMATLPAAHPERAAFVTAHQALGLTVLLLAAVRVGWFVFNPPPAPISVLATWEAGAARGAHMTLYLLLFLFPVSGYLLNASQDAAIDFYGWSVPAIGRPSEPLTVAAEFAHNWALPLLFYAAIALHVGAVLIRHFKEQRKDAVRRMLR
jgi:cytochrome b561